MRVKGWRGNKKIKNVCEIILRTETEQRLSSDGDIDARLVICSTSLSRVQIFRSLDHSIYRWHRVSTNACHVCILRTYCYGEFAVVINCYFRPQ